MKQNGAAGSSTIGWDWVFVKPEKAEVKSDTFWVNMSATETFKRLKSNIL